MLAKFYTDAYVGRGSHWHILTKLAPLIPGKWRPAAWQRLQERREDSLPADKIVAFNLFGMAVNRAHPKAPGLGELEKLHREYGRRFCDLVWRHNGLGQAQGIYSFPWTSLPLFQRAKRTGMKCILEQFSAPGRIYRNLLAEEVELFADWEPTQARRRMSDEIIEQEELEQNEWQEADAIICPSGFVAQGLRDTGVPSEKLREVPYGVDAARFPGERQPWDGGRPLRVLFVGGVSLGKGPQYLCKALERLNSHKIVARMVGPVSIVEPYQTRLQRRVELTGRRPRQEMRRHYEWADLFVLPSICEGSATVNYEALAAGLPVITTPNAGSVVRDGVEGFIVPIRDAEALAARIELLASDPGLLAHLAQKAKARAAEYSWERYGERLTETLIEVMQ
jgi:glycosyltransferase involved in cell wall biosynthesis